MSPQRLWFTLAVILLLCCTMIVWMRGKLSQMPEAPFGNVWMSGGDFKPPKHINQYYTMDEYPEYAIAVRNVPDESDIRTIQRKYVSDSLSQIRAAFGAAHAAGQLQRWSNADRRALAFDPQWLCVIFDEADRFVQPFPVSQESITESGTAFILPIKEVFDPALSIRTLCEKADVMKSKGASLQYVKGEDGRFRGITRHPAIDAHSREHRSNEQ